MLLPRCGSEGARLCLSSRVMTLLCVALHPQPTLHCFDFVGLYLPVARRRGGARGGGWRTAGRARGGRFSQNVDGLHQKAGSRNVVDLHGRNDKVR